MQHKDITIEAWTTLPLVVRLANVGSEVLRAISWRKKGNNNYSTLAFHRALELIDLTLQTSLTPTQRREIARVRSVLVDDFVGDNTYRSSDECWSKYFMAYTYAANTSTRRVV